MNKSSVLDPGFKLKKNYNWKKSIFFSSTIAIYLSLGLPTGRPKTGKAFSN
jgi:hypothetical protein